ncbi:MAG TPA: glycerophosphodiester phosphodiesterase family protein [Caulobacteraceae bacterium]|jgi:glycerophosphoryl diester phosphodiesterase|nr:glycerophosphodiester phosphodiesterase family protein [Caulobacteraceae bacterium]
MKIDRRTFGVSLVAASIAPPAVAQSRSGRPPLIVAMGGLTGAAPPASRAAYAAAVAAGADMLGADLACTKDGVVVVRPDVELTIDTDIASRAEYVERRTTRFVGADKRDGWFIDDFNLAELKSLTLKGAVAKTAILSKAGERPGVITLEELIGVARAQSVKTARVVGVWLRLLSPEYFERAGLALEPKVAQGLRLQGYDARAAAAFVATPEKASLATLKEITGVRLVFAPLQPPGAAELDGIAHVASGLALDATALVKSEGRSLADSGLAGAVETAGLGVHALAGRAGLPWPPPPIKSGEARKIFEVITRAGARAIVTGDVASALRGRTDGMRTQAKG